MSQDKESTFDWATRNVAGTYANAEQAASKLRLAAQHCHLIGGAAITPQIEGHDVQVTVIPINRADCYPIQMPKQKEGEPPPVPRKGIPKSTLMQIANAAGVEWDAPVRLDDGRDPYYCLFQVKGRYMTIDGTYRPIVGERDVDLRDGSDQIGGKSEFAVRELRANMIRSAITKAKLRALRDAFGVSQGMPETEIDKPFVFAKAVFTGRSSNPQTAQMFAQVIAYKQLAASAALYGGTMPTLQLPAYQEGPRQLQARVVEYTEEGEMIEHAPQAPGPMAPPPPPPPRPAARANGNGNGNGAKSGVALVIPGGTSKGTPIADATDKDLAYWAGRIGSGLESGDTRDRERDQTLLNAMLAEQKRRTTPQAPTPGDRGDNPDNY